MNETKTFNPLTPKLALLLAAPHTWVASIMPVLVAVAGVRIYQGIISFPLVLAMLAISVLLQSSVNTFNDYFDYIKGADSRDDNVEASDSVLVYENVNPRSALLLAIGFGLVCIPLGIYVMSQSGWLVPLVIALIALLTILLYSGGPLPLSYLPVGELISGFVMGGLIALASDYVLSYGSLDLTELIWALPCIIGIGLIMMTNNTCDIEKDIEAKRKTLPVCLGRAKSHTLYRFFLVLWVLIIIANGIVFFSEGIIIIPFMILAAYQPFKLMWSNPLEPKSRIQAMGQIVNLNMILGLFYVAEILAAGTGFFDLPWSPDLLALPF